MADPQPPALYVQILAREQPEQPPRVMWEGKVSPANLRRLITAASNMWLDELAASASRFERDVRGILSGLREVAQDRAFDVASKAAKLALKQAALLREGILDQKKRK